MNETKQGALATAIVCSLLVAGGVFFLLRQSRDTEPRYVWHEDGVTDAPARLRPLPLLSSPDSELRRFPQQEPAEVVESGSSEGPTSFLARGTILEAGSLAPIAGAHVALTSARRQEGTGIEQVEATSEAWGQVGFTLRRGPWEFGDLCQAVVAVGEREVFRGTVRLLEDFVIVARRELILRGRVVAQSAPTVVAGVTAYTPKYAAVNTPIACGSAPVSPEGWFEMRATPDVVPEDFLLAIQLGSHSLLTRSAPTADLLSETGAWIEIDLVQFDCSVFDSDGSPLADAKVHLAAADGGHSGRATTDEEGRASLAAPAGWVEVCVGREGYSSVTERRQLSEHAGSLNGAFELQPLSDDDGIHGRVLFGDGSPVEDAFVSVVPAASDPDLELAGFVGWYTDAVGRFELRARASEGLVRLRAFRRGEGLADELVFVPDGREVTLWLQRRGTAVLNLQADGFGGPFGSGPIQYIFVHRFVDAAAIGHTWRPPVRVEEVVEADYNVYVYAPGFDAFGQASLHVAASGTSAADVPLAPVRWFTGSVVFRDGSPATGVRLRVTDEGWPAEVTEHLATVAVEPDGSFRLFGGHQDRVAVEVLEPWEQRFELGRFGGNRLTLAKEAGAETIR